MIIIRNSGRKARDLGSQCLVGAIQDLAMKRHRHWKQLAHYFPSMPVVPSLYPRQDNTRGLGPENLDSHLWLSISGTKPVVWRQQQGLVWWAHRGHSVSHYPDDFLMAVWLDSARNDMPLSPSVGFCLRLSWSISRHVPRHSHVTGRPN